MIRKTYICSDCKKECELKVIDEGIGGYEYWGARGNHSDPVVYSACCEATVVDEDGDEMSQSQLFTDISDDFDDAYYPYEPYE